MVGCDLDPESADETARHVPLDQLCLSPQCGFSSTVDGNALTRDEQVEKLRLVVEVAGEVWGLPSGERAARPDSLTLERTACRHSSF